MGRENKVYVEWTFECAPEALFDWLTKPELIAQWFGPEGFSTGKIKNTLEVGGSYQIELKKNENLVFEIHGKYIEVQKPYAIQFTYDYNGLENPPPPSVVQFRLSEMEGGTMLSMVQEFEIETPDFAIRTKAWKFMFERLSQII